MKDDDHVVSDKVFKECLVCQAENIELRKELRAWQDKFQHFGYDPLLDCVVMGNFQ